MTFFKISGLLTQILRIFSLYHDTNFLLKYFFFFFLPRLYLGSYQSQQISLESFSSKPFFAALLCSTINWPFIEQERSHCFNPIPSHFLLPIKVNVGSGPWEGQHDISTAASKQVSQGNHGVQSSGRGTLLTKTV